MSLWHPNPPENCSPLTCQPVLFHAVAAVVELSEGGGELVQVVAQHVQQQVVHDLLQNLREAEDALPQLPLLLVVQQDFCGLGRLLQGGLVDVSQASDGPVGPLITRSQMVDPDYVRVPQQESKDICFPN